MESDNHMHWAAYRRAMLDGDALKGLTSALGAAQIFEQRDNVRDAGIWHREASFALYVHHQSVISPDVERLPQEMTSTYKQAMWLVKKTKKYALSLQLYEAFKALAAAEELARSIDGDDRLWGQFYGCKAICLARAGDAEGALQDNQRAVHFMRRAGQFRHAAGFLNSIGFWLAENQQFEKGEQYLLEAHELMVREPHPLMQTALCASLGYTYAMMRRLDDAERFLIQSITVSEAASDNLTRLIAFLRILAFHDFTRNQKGACDMAERALKLANEMRYEPLRQQIGQRLNSAQTKRRVLTNSLRWFHDILYISEPMREVVSQIQAIGPTQEIVLVLGETGTGKELIARAIHQESSRRQGPFVPFNCSALSRDLIESRLFGHRKGAFTSAGQDQQGVISAAIAGTLFLDEIGELSLEAQGALLRFLQSGEIQSVGESTPRKVNVRVIAATNCNLQNAVTAGRFRKDLYYRLNALTLYIPPLRSRPADIPALAKHFAHAYSLRYARPEPLFSGTEMAGLTAYDWPGNVRELENYIRRHVIFGSQNIQAWADANSQFSNGSNIHANQRDAQQGEREPDQATSRAWRRLSATEKHQRLSETLERHSGNVTAAAEQLGISRRTIYNALRKLQE